jgi:hypothetical protein
MFYKVDLENERNGLNAELEFAQKRIDKINVKLEEIRGTLDNFN